jgi:glucan phosphorylase
MITMRHGTQDGWWVEIISHFINWNLWNNSLMHWTPT